MYRKVSENERTNALSRRDQDKPKEGDPCLLIRERQLLNLFSVTKILLRNLKMVVGKNIFTNADLQLRWNMAIEKDSS